MPNATDRDYLQEQYGDTSRLNARVAVHQRLGTATVDWQKWVFDHFALPPDARILELGRGPGRLRYQNLGRLPSAGK